MTRYLVEIKDTDFAFLKSYLQIEIACKKDNQLTYIDSFKNILQTLRDAKEL